ncbi:MAG: hypothetical protein QOG54_1830 [Actinomycetota bacterium]|nr:hypothetical protein [Actinomycetota bacterium]
MSRRTLVILGIAFIACRIFTTAAAFRPINIATSGDVGKYESWANDLIDGDKRAYKDIEIEYPPGSLPFIAAPKVLGFAGDTYRDRFVWLMTVVDLIGFAGVIVLAHRYGSWIGPALWILGGLLLGPIIYLRLDLLPAVATIWAVERASVGAWSAAGALLGFGAAAKVYPAFLIPATFVASPRKRSFALGCVAIVAALVIPIFITGAGPDLMRDVVQYHGLRGIQIESTWGGFLLLASRFGYAIFVTIRFGAYEVISTAGSLLKNLALSGSLIALVAGTFLVHRKIERDDVPTLALGLYGILALLMFFGTVFSPQYGIWLVALAAVAACWPRSTRALIPLLLVLVVAGLTQIVFPYTIGEVIQPLFEGGTRTGNLPGLMVLLARNLIVAVIGVLALLNVRSSSSDLSGNSPV